MSSSPIPHDSSSHPRKPGHPVGEAILLVVGVLTVGIGGLWWSSGAKESLKTRSQNVAVRYAGDRSCRECHPAETALHSRSGHARTLRPASAIKLDGVSVVDPERPEVTWRYSLRDGKLEADREQAGASDVERYLLEYAFGSGHHAVTFLSMRGHEPPTALEHRLTVFAHQEKPGLTPGQSLAGHASGNSPHGRVHDALNTRLCFGCHTTLTSDRGPDVLDPRTMVPNVGCERCHGPARSHVEAARRGDSGSGRTLTFAAGRTTTAEQMTVCGACHRLPEMVKAADICPENPILVRHQTVGLMQSACYMKSQGGLSCLSCHDPHSRTSTDRASYEKACRSCHGAPAQTPCPVSPRDGCIDCHMPKRDVARGMMMTDHWIRTRPQSVRRDLGIPAGATSRGH